MGQVMIKPRKNRVALLDIAEPHFTLDLTSDMPVDSLRGAQT